MMTIQKHFVLLSIIFSVSVLTSTVYAQEGNVTSSNEPKFLAIQSAQSGSISKINDTAYSLELNDISDKTILFSDRPERIVTSIASSDFIGNWSAGGDSFAEDAPNAVLVVDDLEGHDTTVVELFNPVYDIEKNILRYEVMPDNATSLKLPMNFGKSTLIIDSSITIISKCCFGGG